METNNISTIEKNIIDIKGLINKERPNSLDLWDCPGSEYENNPDYKWGVITQKNSDILNKFSIINKFLSSKQIEDFLSYTEGLKSFLSELNQPSERLDRKNPPKSPAIPLMRELTVGNHNYTSQELVDILDHMQEKEIDLDISLKLRELILNPNLTPELISELASILVKFHNSHFEQDNKTSAQLFTEASLKLHQIEIWEELEKAKAAAKEITLLNHQAARDLGLPTSKNLIERYKNEYQTLNWPIWVLSFIIFSIFIILLLGIAYISFFLIHSNNLPDLSKVYFLYFSFMLVASGLLAYCIKEKSRLISIRHKLMISYLELISLSDYMFEFDLVERVSLRKQLASTYFQGGNEQPRESNDLSLISERVSDLTKIVNDLKSAIK